MAVIRVEGLLIEAVIGVYDWERDLPQQLLVSMELTSDISNLISADIILTSITKGGLI